MQNDNYNNEERRFFESDVNMEQKVFMLERRIALLEQSTQTIKTELNKINTNISKLVWIVMSAVVLAGLNVIFNGSGGV